ncbi:MAG TPA: Gfo/Idh/MocA family oxidoreductase [Propioniciclava tarda]|nr:Gfo/Idh/MocA family oxidoreductase [Propioniciclava tarda]
MSLPSVLPSSRVPDPRDAPPLRWGILATGGIARAFAEALRLHTRQVVLACGSRTQDAADRFAAAVGAERAYGSYEALVADPDVDAIYVASPHSHHAEHALLAIAAGKPVLVEKSFTRTAAEAHAVVDAARAAGVLAMEAMWTRFQPGADIIRQLLAGGVLGELETVLADHGQAFAFDPTHRLYAPELAGGALLDLGIYPLSFAFFALGRPGRVTTVGSLAPTGVDRQLSLILDGFAAAPNAQALLNTTLAAKTPTTASISGSEARVELPGPFYIPQPVTLIGRDGVQLTSAQPTIPAHQGLCYQAAHFATLAKEGRLESPLLPLDETLAIMETMDLIRTQLHAS